ncbi:hypothetical protein E4U58_005564 [Claviceps cyperi]|nr:hypothetical protein E4U58_005564 [Claviceps cyperi]
MPTRPAGPLLLQRKQRCSDDDAAGATGHAGRLSGGAAGPETCQRPASALRRSECSEPLLRDHAVLPVQLSAHTQWYRTAPAFDKARLPSPRPSPLTASGLTHGYYRRRRSRPEIAGSRRTAPSY